MGQPETCSPRAWVKSWCKVGRAEGRSSLRGVEDPALGHGSCAKALRDVDQAEATGQGQETLQVGTNGVGVGRDQGCCKHLTVHWAAPDPKEDAHSTWLRSI